MHSHEHYHAFSYIWQHLPCLVVLCQVEIAPKLQCTHKEVSLCIAPKAFGRLPLKSLEPISLKGIRYKEDEEGIDAITPLDAQLNHMAGIRCWCQMPSKKAVGGIVTEI